MMNSTKVLPEGYIQAGQVNLKKNKGLAILLNIFAFFVSIFSFILLSSFAAMLRPELMNTSETISIGALVGLALVVVLLLTIHELIHGIFFWMFTHSKPVFAIRMFYAYAGAPDWYIPVRQFLWVAAAPLVIIDAVGLLLILVVPQSWIIYIICLVAFHTGGSIGDLLVLVRLIKMPPTSFANDTGDVMTVYNAQATVS